MIELDLERFTGAFVMAKRDKGSTVAQVATELGISTATVGRLRVGRHKPHVDTFLAACQWMGRPAEDFTS